MRISDWSSDVCSSDLPADDADQHQHDAEADRHRCQPFGDGPPARSAHPQQGDPDHRQEDAPIALGAGDPHQLAAIGAALGGVAEIGCRHVSLSTHRPAAPRSRSSEEHTSELQSLMRISYAVFCLKKKKTNKNKNRTAQTKDK